MLSHEDAKVGEAQFDEKGLVRCYSSRLIMARTSLKTLSRRYLVDPVLVQLKQGITPEKIAQSIVIGAAISVFPVLGITTTLCLVAGVVLGLNQPLLQLVNYLAYPLQLILIPVFIRLGEWLFRAPHLPFSLTQISDRFHAAPMHFIGEFAISLMHASAAWLLVVPPLGIVVNWTLRPVLRAVAASRFNRPG